MTDAPARPASGAKDTPDHERVVDIDLTDEMADSFLEYAYSVIYQRALPDARDGLKPVQRRILYQMSDMGLRPDRGHVKSARVVGEVMGKLHPHGDQAIYDALVRLAQDFTLRVPMVDGHGNFGSLDDGPAAARYTEARLRPEALAMVADLDEDVVNFVPNYDNQLTQPEVLPAAIPHLLVNGASGIAVGMATNMAPHNLREVIAGAQHLIDDPDASLKDVMAHIPGPDLPGGAMISGLEGIRDAYETGRGSFRMRATTSIEPVGPRSTGIVVTELPYLVGPERVIEKIKDAVQSKKLQGISDVNDLTDRTHGLRLVIGVKSGFDPKLVLDQLYRLTPLEESFSINNVALVNGTPRTLGLLELLSVFIAHRIDVVTRRSTHRLKTKRARLHLVEGLLVAIVDIDEVIAVIRSSDDGQAAKNRLCDVFDLTDIQADYILELRLRRLTKFSRIELETERDTLQQEIAHLESLLDDPAKIRGVVRDELGDVAERFGTPRRTRLVKDADAPPPAPSAKKVVSAERQDQSCRLLVTTTGRATVRLADGDDVSITVPPKRPPHDALLADIVTTTRSPIGVVSADGTLTTIDCGDIPGTDGPKLTLSQGVKLSEFLGLAKNHGPIIGVFPLGDTAPTIALGTRQGTVKRIDLAGLAAKPDQSLIALKDGDRVVGASAAPDESWLCFVTDKAQLLRFSAASVRPQGAQAAGMAGITIPDSAQVISFGAALTESWQVVTVSTAAEALTGVDAGRAKVSELSVFPPKGRGTSGVRCHAFVKGEDALALAGVFDAPRALTPAGKPVDLPTELSKRDASGSPIDQPVGSLGSALLP
jgi:DNA gyrase subunit A